MDAEQLYATSQCFSACVVQQRGCMCAQENRDEMKSFGDNNNKTFERRLTQEVHVFDANLQPAETRLAQPCNKCGHVRKVTDRMLIAARPVNFTNVQPRPLEKELGCNANVYDKLGHIGRSFSYPSQSLDGPKIVVGIDSTPKLDHPYSRDETVEYSCPTGADLQNLELRNRLQTTTAQPNRNTSTKLNFFQHKNKALYKVKSNEKAYLCKVLRHEPHFGHASVKPWIYRMPTKPYTKHIYPPLSETKNDAQLLDEFNILNSRGKTKLYQKRYVIDPLIPGLPSQVKEEEEDRTCIYPNTHEGLHYSNPRKTNQQETSSNTHKNIVYVSSPSVGDKKRNAGCIPLLKRTDPRTGISVYTLDDKSPCTFRLQHTGTEVASDPYIGINKAPQISIKQEPKEEPGTYPNECTNPVSGIRTSIHSTKEFDLEISTNSIKQENEVCTFLFKSADQETSDTVQVKTENLSETRTNLQGLESSSGTVANPFIIEDEPIKFNTGPTSNKKGKPEGSSSVNSFVNKCTGEPKDSGSDQCKKAKLSCATSTKPQVNPPHGNKQNTLHKQTNIHPNKLTNRKAETVTAVIKDKFRDVESSRKDQPAKQTLFTPVSTGSEIGQRPISGPVEIGVKINTKSSSNICFTNEGQRLEPSKTQISVMIDRSKNEILCIHKRKLFKGMVVNGALKLLEPLAPEGDSIGPLTLKTLKDHPKSCDTCNMRLDKGMLKRRRKLKFKCSDDDSFSDLVKNPVVKDTGEIEWSQNSGERLVYHGLDNIDNTDIAMDVEIQNNGSEDEGLQCKEDPQSSKKRKKTHYKSRQKKNTQDFSENVRNTGYSTNDTEFFENSLKTSTKHCTGNEDEELQSGESPNATRVNSPSDFRNLTESVYTDSNGPLIMAAFEDADGEDADSADNSMEFDQ